MKNIKYYLMILVMSFGLFFSCGDLEENPKTILTSDKVINDPEGLESSVYALYNYLKDVWGTRVSNHNYSIWNMVGTDLTIMDQAPWDSYSPIYSPNLNGELEVVQHWWNLTYEYISRANTIINRADAIGFKSETRKNRLVAEAKFFRAYMNFYLIQRYGRIALVTEQIESIRNEEKPADPNEVYQLIKSDLDFAVNNLEYKYSDQPGRITKAAALHLSAKVYLVLKDWQKAAAASERIINESPHKMLDDFKLLWADNNQNNAEAIYVVQYDPGAAEQFNHGFNKMFVPQYDRVTGILRSCEQGGRAWSRALASNYLLSLYDKKDERLDGTFYRYWKYDNASKLPTGVKLGDTVRVGGPGVGNPLYIQPAVKKYWDCFTRLLNDNGSWKDVIVYRLAETYLIAAEANMELGNTSKALQYINTVRRRAFNDTAHDLSSINIDIILEERARELAFEGHRWFDLKRTGKLVDMVKKHNPQAAPNIKDYHVNMPIPQDFVDLAKNFPQNPGYY